MQARPLPYATFPTCFNAPPAGKHPRGCMIFGFPLDSAALYFIAFVADACHLVHLGCFPKVITLLLPIAALKHSSRIIVSTLTD